MTRTAEIRIWLIVLIAAIAFVWIFQDILLPFVLGLAIAYLLDPLVEWMCRRGIRRWAASVLVLIAFGMVAAMAILLLLPLMQTQISALIRDLPGWIDYLGFRFHALLALVQERVPPEDLQRLQQQIGAQLGEAMALLGRLLGQLVAGSLALVNLLGVLFVTPIVAYYMLRDWDRLIIRVDSLLPRQHADTVRAQAHLIDQALAGFVRGQGLVCLCLGAYYAIGLSAAGLRYGFTIGLIAGLITFMPYVGSLFGLITSVGLALAQFDSWGRIAVVAGVFMFGQIVEGQFLAPRIVGERVGLHPLWVIFALFAGGSVLGFLGMLVAIPIAAIIGVLSRFVLSRYLESRLYLGREE